MINDIVDNSILELRRGVVVMAALTILRKEGYGYSVLRQLAENGLKKYRPGHLISPSKKVEMTGLLQSAWQIKPPPKTILSNQFRGTRNTAKTQ